MKYTQIERAVQERMRPGHITALGLLGDDQRPVADIMQADSEAFSRLGMDFDQVADLLERLRSAGQDGLGEPITVDNRYLVSTGDARGVLPCPWNDGVHHKNAITVQDQRSGRTIIYSDLSIHLLRVHHFCQGKGSPFRLDPDTLAAIL